ncbi:MAG: hypothetical protein HPY50_02340 [Firmicutes bacterium]|nr:hypothetical protein [Bacillota bacterium]
MKSIFKSLFKGERGNQSLDALSVVTIAVIIAVIVSAACVPMLVSTHNKMVEGVQSLNATGF